MQLQIIDFIDNILFMIVPTLRTKKTGIQALIC